MWIRTGDASRGRERSLGKEEEMHYDCKENKEYVLVAENRGNFFFGRPERKETNVIKLQERM